MTSEEELAAAEAKSRAARQQLTATMVDIQQRLNPRVLVREAITEVREAGTELLRAGLSQARRNPGPLIGIAATIAAFVARDWFIGHAARAPEPEPEAAPPPAETADKKDAGKKDRDLIKTGMKRPPRRKR